MPVLRTRLDSHGLIGGWLQCWQRIGPEIGHPQCSQYCRVCLVRFLHTSFGSCWLPVIGVFAHQHSPSCGSTGPPQSRQKFDPTLTACCVTMPMRLPLCCYAKIQPSHVLICSFGSGTDGVNRWASWPAESSVAAQRT